MAVLLEARKLQLIASLDAPLGDGSPAVVPPELLLRASEHASDALRLDALQLACISAKSTALPGELCIVHVTRGQA